MKINNNIYINNNIPKYKLIYKSKKIVIMNIFKDRKNF